MAERVRLHVDGETIDAEAGVTVLVALWNAGVRTVRASVAGEPRGPLCGMGVCMECRVTIDGRAQRRACLETVRDGLEVRTRG
jgi:predicted molibdopterin-dependent oxidoreductase YjgC